MLETCQYGEFDGIQEEYARPVLVLQVPPRKAGKSIGSGTKTGSDRVVRSISRQTGVKAKEGHDRRPDEAVE